MSFTSSLSSGGWAGARRVPGENGKIAFDSDQLRLTKGPAFDFESDWQPLLDGDCHDRRG